jgi:TBC1 domain family member 8/9
VYFYQDLSSPLYLQFSQTLPEQQRIAEGNKEAAWEAHFNIYGHDTTMFRTNELYELIFQGIPKSLRPKLWLIFSGAIHEVYSPSERSEYELLFDDCLRRLESNA